MLTRVRELQFKGRFAIVSTMVNKHRNSRWGAEEPYAHVHGELKAKVATMSLNKGHKNNFLTPTMIKEVQRYFKSFDLDDMIDLVWCQSSHPGVFSQGTDLKYLLVKVKENKNQEALNYLAQIQDCAKTFATYNKATLTYIRGDVSGSAAAMVGSAAFGLTDDTVKWWMNETKYGFIPHGGASYVFSRMPRELGTYLSLTGDHLNQEDLITLGLAKYRLDTSYQDMAEDLSGLMLDDSRPGHTRDLYGNMFQEFRYKRATGYDEYIDRVDQEIQQRIFSKDPDLAEDPRLVMAEVLYRNQQVQKANLDFELQNNKLTQKTQRIQNYLKHFEDNIFNHLKHLGHLSSPTTLRISCEHPAIARCFSADTLEEILERLKAENSEWAKNVIENLELRSPLSLKLTLKLIREAEKSSWIKCIENEYNVMTKLINQPDFQLGVSKLTNKSDKEQWSKPSKDISNNEIQHFFEEQHLKHGVVENSLHPVKAYYVKYPDNVRLFLNEETLYGDLRARAAQEVDVLAFLKNNNLPISDSTISVARIRRIVMNAEEKARITFQKVSKLFELCGSAENLQKYYEMRLSYINDQFSQGNQSKINHMIESAVDKVFLDKFQERMDAYSHIASVKLHKDKSDMFSQIRNTLLNKRLTTSETNLLQTERWRGTDRMLFFPSDDKVSFLDTYNDSLEDTTLFKKLYARYIKTEPEQLEKEDPKQYKYLLSPFTADKEDPFDRLNKEYNQLYGDPLQEFNLDRYHNQLMKMGNRSKKIQDLIKSTGSEKVKQMLKENTKLTEQELANNLEKYIEYHEMIDNQQKQNKFELHTKLIAHAKQIQGQQSFSKKLEQLTQLDTPQNYNTNIQAIKNKLHQFINSEKLLKETIQPIFNAQLPNSFSSLQKKYDTLLSTVYQGKIKSFLHQHKLISFNEQLAYVDNLLNSEIERDLNKLLEPHVFFTFAFLLLKDMATYYDLFQDISNNVPKQAPEYKERLIQAIKNRTGLSIDEPELNQFFIYIDQLTHLAITLFVIYKDQIHFTSEIALLQLIQLQQKRAGEEMQANPKNKTFFQIVTEQAAKNQQGWQKSTLMHYIENQTVGFNPFFTQRDLYQMEKDIKKYPNIADYQTDVYERRALRLAKNIKPQLLKEFIPGMQHYLMQIDLNTAKALRKDEQITPEYIQNALQQLEEIDEIKVITQNHSVAQWFQDKINSCIQELFNYRRKYELKLTGDQLIKFDMEFSKLLEPHNFKATLLQSFDREMDDLGEVAKHVHKAQNRSEDKIFQDFKASTNVPTPSKNVPLLMSAVSVPLYFDLNTTHFQNVPTDGILQNEIELPESPFKKGRKIKDRPSHISKDHQKVRALKLKQELISKLDPVFEGLYEQDVMATSIHASLKYVYERIQLKKQISRTGNRE